MRPAGPTGAPCAALILAGGAGRRMGGRDKPLLRVAGRSLLEVAVAAVEDCGPVLVVGPRRGLGLAFRQRSDLAWTGERPPGGGPAAAAAHGAAELDRTDPAGAAGGLVVVLASDLPGVTPATVRRMRAVLDAGAGGPVGGRPEGMSEGGEVWDGAVLTDAAGRRQHLIGIWRRPSLARAAAARRSWHGVALRELWSTLRVLDLPAADAETADVDTPADAARWGAE